VAAFGLGLLVIGPTTFLPTYGQSVLGVGRGVVTGTVMFCRYLGQSLGAAIFGAIFNAALSGKLHAAPGPLRHRLPDQVRGLPLTWRGRKPRSARTAPGGRGLPSGRARHRHQPRLRRAHGGGGADHRQLVADHAEAIQHGRR
jgi:hypothetical protein